MRVLNIQSLAGGGSTPQKAPRCGRSLMRDPGTKGLQSTTWTIAAIRPKSNNICAGITFSGSLAVFREFELCSLCWFDCLSRLARRRPDQVYQIRLGLVQDLVYVSIAVKTDCSRLITEKATRDRRLNPFSVSFYFSAGTRRPYPTNSTSP